MTADGLESLIKAEGVSVIAQAVGRFWFAKMLKEGLDLTCWRAQTAAGAVLFFQCFPDGIVTADPRILCVNAPESERGWWEAYFAQGDAPDAPTRILMTPIRDGH